MRRAAAASAAALLRRAPAGAERRAGGGADAFPRHPSALTATWLTAALREAGRIPPGATVTCAPPAPRRSVPRCSTER